jgi:transcriptional regulator with XRE-family HTH domain
VKDLKSARSGLGLTQAQAAARLGVSQSYFAMLETGTRRLTPALARRAVRVFGLTPTALLPHDVETRSRRTKARAVAADLAVLGYPGSAHLRPGRLTPRNPAQVLLEAMERDDLEARVVEALPWLVLKYWPLDQAWLVREAKLQDLQNRLGFVVTLARGLAQQQGDGYKAAAWPAWRRSWSEAALRVRSRSVTRRCPRPSSAGSLTTGRRTRAGGTCSRTGRWMPSVTPVDLPEPWRRFLGDAVVGVEVGRPHRAPLPDAEQHVHRAHRRPLDG